MWPRPLPIDGKMATENCDGVNMDPDMELLSDEELERYDNISLCCQRLKNTCNEVSYWHVCSKVTAMLNFSSYYESEVARHR